MSESRPSQVRRWGAGAIAIGGFAAVQTFVFFARRDHFSVLLWWTRESWLYVSLLWLKDLALAAAAFFLFANIARATVNLPEPAERPLDREAGLRDALLFAAIFAAGVALRWLAPRQIPPGVWADALFEAEGALRDPGNIPWLGGRPLEIEGLRNSALVSHLYLKLCALLFRIFGRGDTGILALSAVGGSLALPAIYWLGREIGSARRALAAMAILAFASWPLVFSRWAWTGALLLPLVLAAAACALRALRTGRVPPAFAAGVLVGLSLHTHPAAWAAAAGLGAFGLTVIRRQRAGRLLAAAALGGFLAFLPFGVAFLKFPDRVGGRARDVSYIGGSTKDVAIPGRDGPFALPLFLFYNAIEYTGIFLWTHDPNPRHGLPDRPPLDPVLGFAALAGAAVALRKARSGDEGERLVLCVVGATLLAGLLANPGGAPNLSRVYPVVAAPALWAAAALVRWIPAAARPFAIRRGFAWALTFVLLFVLETRPFLVAWPRDPRVLGSFCVAETDAGRTARVLGPAPIVLDPKAFSWPIVLETLAAPSDPSVSVPKLSRRTPADLALSPPARPFWYVATRDALEELRDAGFRAAKGTAVSEVGHAVISRVRPPSLIRATPGRPAEGR